MSTFIGASTRWADLQAALETITAEPPRDMTTHQLAAVEEAVRRCEDAIEMGGDADDDDDDDGYDDELAFV